MAVLANHYVPQIPTRYEGSEETCGKSEHIISRMVARGSCIRVGSLGLWFECTDDIRSCRVIEIEPSRIYIVLDVLTINSYNVDFRCPSQALWWEISCRVPGIYSRFY
jgi:hypothetical protein